MKDEVIMNPRYDAVRPNQKKTAAVMRRPAEKKKTVAEAQKKLNDEREEQEKKSHELRLAEEKMKVSMSSKGIKKSPRGGPCVGIAPREYASFSDRALERLIRHLLRKNPALLKQRKYVGDFDVEPLVQYHDSLLHKPKAATAKYTQVEPTVQGPKFTVAQNYSVNKAEDELEKLKAPGP